MPMAQGGGDGGLMACQLTLAATAGHHPGDTVTALLQVSCSQPEAVELQVGRLRTRPAGLEPQLR
jgi:hypothetical protein